ncbi:MAG: LD-carboxypeptidase [bacterium]|nr:LD-carboxypeptidase [Candidatus Limimorpha caballi]
MISPKYLTKDSKIALVAPARKISREEIKCAVDWIKDKGFIPVYDDRLFAEYHQLAGDDDFRASVLQHYLDRDDIAAIFCVRGGYGTIRIIDRLDFTKFAGHPKWIVGYSDVTVLHAKMQQLGYQSIHATMPINFPSNTKEALDSLYDALTGEREKGKGKRGKGKGKRGKGKGGEVMWEDCEIVGGNLSVLYSMLGSDLFPDTDGKWLFIEDLDEYIYHIDRMMTALKRAGKLAHLKGLVVGAFTQMHDNAVPFGMTAKEIISEKVKEYDYQVVWDFPAGHIDDNRAMIFG